MIEYGKRLRVRVLAVYGGQPYAPQINNLNRVVVDDGSRTAALSLLRAWDATGTDAWAEVKSA